MMVDNQGVPIYQLPTEPRTFFNRHYLLENTMSDKYHSVTKKKNKKKNITKQNKKVIFSERA